ncbi:MAG TPA: aminoacyl-tRNA hydrolase [Candidatus Kapabacteria bacterium]|nr:aminoacyl-tRNA hydrolase [Candidatus Kapabacteria bacterium]
MKLIVGLGNPGPRYTFTRHNIGWRVLDAIAVKEDIQFKPGRGDYMFARKVIGKVDTALIKPTTFMNDSGIALLQALDVFRAHPERDILIVLDEFQLPLGSVKLKAMGGDGGHNGLASIIYHLQTERIARLRCGIDKSFQDGQLVDYVLSPFTDDEETLVEDMVTLARDTAVGFAMLGTIRAMNTFNQLSPKKKGFPPAEKSGNK